MLSFRLWNEVAILSPHMTTLGFRFAVLQLEWYRRVCAGELRVRGDGDDDGAAVSGVDQSPTSTVRAPSSPSSPSTSPELTTGGSSGLAISACAFPATPTPTVLLLPQEPLADALDYIAFIATSSAPTLRVVDTADIEALLVCVIAFLRNPRYIHSPHLQATFGKVRGRRYLRVSSFHIHADPFLLDDRRCMSVRVVLCLHTRTTFSSHVACIAVP